MKKNVVIGLLIIILFIALFIFLKQSKKDEIIRIPLNQETDQREKALSYKTYRVQGEGSYLSLKNEDFLSTLRGTQLFPITPSQRTTSVKLTPNLKGKYIIEFSISMMSTTGRISKAYLKHIRNKELKRIRLRIENDLTRHRIPVELEENDTLEFLLRNADVGLISDPIFFKVSKSKKKDYVFIVIADTMRWDRIGIYNSSRTCAPNLTEFAKDSVLFTQAYSTSPWTVPAHMSLFTGLFPNKHHVNYGNERLETDIMTLFEILQGKFINYSVNGNHFVSSRFGFHRGFDSYVESFDDCVSKYASRKLFERAKELIKEEKSGSALFFLHTYQVHNPYNPEIELATKFYNDDFDKFRYNTLWLIDHGRELFKILPEKEKEEIERIYDAAVYTFDTWFGDFLNFLKRHNLYRNSMIIFLSDHGEEFMDHGAWEHGHSLYNELIKIPLILKLPGNKHAGQKVDNVVSILDVLPTVLDFYKMKYEDRVNIDGISLLKAMAGKYDNERIVRAYLAPSALRRGVPTKITAISGHLKYIFNQKWSQKDLEIFKTKPPDLRDELFDIFDDPLEKYNIIDRRKKEAIRFMNHLRSLKYREGKRGFLKELEKKLKSIGYF